VTVPEFTEGIPRQRVSGDRLFETPRLTQREPQVVSRLRLAMPVPELTEDRPGSLVSGDRVL
jgi:hypothetical protein